MFYAQRPDRYDEVFQQNGQPRRHWENLVRSAQLTSHPVLLHRASIIRQAVEQDGVTYNIYGDSKGTDRPWEVDLLPFLISEEEWRVLARAVEQRARLLDRVLADVYGAGTLLAEGLLPPAVIYGHHNYLWPCRDIRPTGDRYLHLYACDLARSPDGGWWVIGDRPYRQLYGIVGIDEFGRRDHLIDLQVLDFVVVAAGLEPATSCM